MYRALILALAIAPFAAAPAAADGFQRVTDRNDFVDLTRNRALTRLGIKVQVTSDGNIIGRAFGGKVSGDWTWNSGYFCRDLYYAGRELDMDNCQTVEVDRARDTLRFTSDRGAGDSANLEIN